MTEKPRVHESKRALDERERRERWDPEQRFRLYVVGLGETPADRREVLATATWEGIGPMARLMREDGEILPTDRTAVLDTAAWEEGEPGEWVLGSLA